LKYTTSALSIQLHSLFFTSALTESVHVCLHRDCQSHDLRDKPGHVHVLGNLAMDSDGNNGK